MSTIEVKNCRECKFKKNYRTGSDEYPANTTIQYCGKGHWENGYILNSDEIDNWVNCKDFTPFTPTAPLNKNQ